MCSNVDVRRTEYPDPTSSPITSSPITPNYHTQARRPSVSSRPSTRDGSIKSLKPEIHIDITAKKGKPLVSITTGKSKRESAGSTSAYESAGSEASHTVRTGYPDVSPPPLNSGHGGLRPQSGHYRNPSSDESIPSSSRVAFAYHNSSDYDTPSLVTGTSTTSSGTRPVLHQATRTMPSQINTTLGQSGAPVSPYRTTEFTPRAAHNDTSYAPEITGRDEDRQRRRDEQRKRQEANDREFAASVMREENRRVHFETSCANDRAEQRADRTYANRAEGREQLRQQESKARVTKEAAAKETAAREAAAREPAAREAASKRSKPFKPAAPSRRNSVRMSSAEAVKQQLLEAEKSQMRKERIEAEAREREEQMQQQQHPPTLQRQQQDPRYYDPRGHGTTYVPAGPPSRRNSLSGSAPRPGLGRTPSTRDTGAPQARSSRREAPMAYYNNTRPNLPQARERRPSSSHGAGPVNPFQQLAGTADPWDIRNVRDSLPSARGPQVGHNFPQPQQANFSQPQQAHHRMSQAFYQGEYEIDSEDDLYTSR